MPDYLARILRTFIQLVAAGSFTALFQQIAKDVPASYTPYVLIVSTLVVTAAQNAAEQAKLIPTMLKPTDARIERV
jgi:hypothetical protein